MEPRENSARRHCLLRCLCVRVFRESADLPHAVFTDPILTTQTPLKRVHLVELRAALQSARSALGLPPLTFSDTELGVRTPIKAIHFQEIRDAIK